MPEEPSRRWMTYAEIAAELGLPSAKAGEAKARRARWERQVGNDGFARVAVPLSALDGPHPLRRRPAEGERRAAEGPTKAPAVSVVVAELKAAHEQSLAELKSSHGQQTGELRERAERAEAEATRERDRAEGALIRAASAEAEAKGLREALDRDRELLAEARRPWWQRLIGR